MRLIDADDLRQVLEVYSEKDSLGHTPVQLCDAMPTIDADQKRIECLQKLVDINTERCEELCKQLRDAHECYEKHLNELEAQLPKHGEWIMFERPNGGYYKGCSLCTYPMPTDMELDYLCEEDNKYCYNCGAKMDGKKFEEPTINPCRGCEDYDGYGGCKSNGGCGRTETEGKEQNDEND